MDMVFSTMAASRFMGCAHSVDVPGEMEVDVLHGKAPVSYPPPAAPPLIPKVGPSDGSLRATMTFLFIFPKA